jgi:hypothetical protein
LAGGGESGVAESGVAAVRERVSERLIDHLARDDFFSINKKTSSGEPLCPPEEVRPSKKLTATFRQLKLN